MRSENKFLRILSFGPPTRSQLFAEAIWRYYPGYSPFGRWRARVGFWKLHNLVQIVGYSEVMSIG